ncbi:MAG TPA: ATP-binding protein [Vicinamibacterales bacterium]|nr:ATP-binding protein [Vicinamibacterales bacterium]
MPLALRTRLTVFYTAVFGVLLTALAAVSYRALAQQLDSDATNSLTELTNGLHGYLRVDDGKPDFVFDPNDPDESAFVKRATRYYQIYDGATGALLAQSEAMEPLGLTFAPAEVKSFRDQPSLHDIETDYGRIRLTNSVIEVGRQTYLLQVGTSLAGMDTALNKFLRLLLWGVPAGLVIAVLAGGWMARVALAPLARLAQAARGIDAVNLRQRLPVRGTRDGLDDVAIAFNDTLARVDAVVSEMRQFSTALAHELRTPIAALRGEIELAAMKPGVPEDARAAAASQLEELDKLKRTIDQLLTLARAESGQIPLNSERVELAPLVESIVDQLEPVAHAQGLTLESDLKARPTVEGDAEWLERLLLNLLDNAFKFTPRGGAVVVRVDELEGQSRLEVRDTGIGMPADVVPHVFERFYRADPARSSSALGAGLGLSLVKWIVDRHHGSVSVTSEPGRGSVFAVHIKKI